MARSHIATASRTHTLLRRHPGHPYKKIIHKKKYGSKKLIESGEAGGAAPKAPKKNIGSLNKHGRKPPKPHNHGKIPHPKKSSKSSIRAALRKKYRSKNQKYGSKKPVESGEAKNAIYAQKARYAINAENAFNAMRSEHALTSGLSTNAEHALMAKKAENAEAAGEAKNANFSLTAKNAMYAKYALNATRVDPNLKEPETEGKEDKSILKKLMRGLMMAVVKGMGTMRTEREKEEGREADRKEKRGDSRGI